MIVIRLARLGRKKDPFYRIVAIDETKKVTGESLANLGYWNPREDKKEIYLEEINNWVAKGAHISPAVQKLVEERKTK